MSRSCTISYVMLLLLSYASAYGQDNDQSEKGVRLNLALARAAIVKLAESSDEPALKVSLENFKSAPFKVGKNGWATAGFYSVHVKKRKFIAAFASPDLFEQFEGIFLQQKNGTWVAIITGVTRT